MQSQKKSIYEKSCLRNMSQNWVESVYKSLNHCKLHKNATMMLMQNSENIAFSCVYPLNSVQLECSKDLKKYFIFS